MKLWLIIGLLLISTSSFAGGLMVATPQHPLQDSLAKTRFAQDLPLMKTMEKYWRNGHTDKYIFLAIQMIVAEEQIKALEKKEVPK
jgi:hypothetical protein